MLGLDEDPSLILTQGAVTGELLVAATTRAATTQVDAMSLGDPAGRCPGMEHRRMGDPARDTPGRRLDVRERHVPEPSPCLVVVHHGSVATLSIEGLRVCANTETIPEP